MPTKRIEPTGVNVYTQRGGLYEKKVTFKKEVKQEISYQATNIGDVPGHQLTNYVRISSVNNSDPDFGPTENLEYGQSDHIKGNGSHRGYSDVHFKNGDKTYYKQTGTHKTTTKEGGVSETNYEGKFEVTGGTGKFKNIRGGGIYKGTITEKGITEEGEYEVEY